MRRDQLERELRKKVQRWQQELDDDPDRDPGTRVGPEQIAQLREQPQYLRESGEEKLSTTDPDARFLRERGRLVLGYRVEIARSEDHFMVAQPVTQNKSDNQALVPMVEEVERQCAERPQRVLTDCGFFSNQNLREREERGIEACVPDANLAREWNTGKRARGVGRMKVSDPHLWRSRQRLRTARGGAWYKKRKGMVEPVFGTLKEPRGMRQFQRRGQPATAVEWTLAAMAYNLTHYRNLRRPMQRPNASDENTRNEKPAPQSKFARAPLRKSTPARELRHRLFRPGLTYDAPTARGPGGARFKCSVEDLTQ